MGDQIFQNVQKFTSVCTSTGFGDIVGADRETVDQMVEKLKNDIKHLNVFVILFNGQVLTRMLAFLWGNLLITVQKSVKKMLPKLNNFDSSDRERGSPLS